MQAYKEYNYASLLKKYQMEISMNLIPTYKRNYKGMEINCNFTIYLTFY